MSVTLPVFLFLHLFPCLSGPLPPVSSAHCEHYSLIFGAIFLAQSCVPVSFGCCFPGPLFPRRCLCSSLAPLSQQSPVAESPAFSFLSFPAPSPSYFILSAASLLSPRSPCFLSFLFCYSASVPPFVSVLLYILEFFSLPFLLLSQG